LDFIRRMVRAIRNAGASLHQFNRGLRGPLKRIADYFPRFQQAGRVTRFLLLLAATAFLSLKLVLFYRQKLHPMLAADFRISRFSQALCLVHFDTLVFISVAAAIVFLIAAGAMGKWPFFKNRPLLTFITATPVLAALLVFIPTIFSGLVLNFSEPFRFTSIDLLPHRVYLAEAVRAALCVGFSLADAAAGPGAVRWWTLPFLFTSPSVFNTIPLLWWNALAGWLPSRYWTFWRPVAALATCVLPILAFPAAQPIRKDMPVFLKGEHQVICPGMGANATGYQVAAGESEDELYIRIGDYMSRVTRQKNGRWLCEKSLPTNFAWDEASFDLERGRAYIFDGKEVALTVVSLAPFGIAARHQIPIDEFPARSLTVRQDWDPARRVLIAAILENAIATIGIDDLQVRQTRFLPTGGPIEQIAVRPGSGALYVLQDFRMSLYRTEDMALLARSDFRDTAGGMALDEDRGRVLVSFPRAMEVRAFDRDTLAVKGVSDAPLGVRTLAVDPKRRWIFLSAISGVIEIRDAADFHLVNRTRMMPWAHWLTVLPEAGEVIITAGLNRTVAWDYAGGRESMDPVGRLLRAGERVMKIAVQKVSEPEKPSEIFDATMESSLTGNARVLVIEKDEKERAFASAILRKAGYKVLAAEGFPEGTAILEKNEPAVDAAIVDFNLMTPRGEKATEYFARSRPGLKIVTSGEPPRMGESNISPDSDVTRPFAFWPLLEAVYRSLNERERRQ
jgi:hypothetical protein